jgi:adenylate cyclase
MLFATKHDPFDRSEIARIRAAEGWVSPKGPGLVNDEINTSRSIIPPCHINARLDICTLSESDEFVIVDNRGLLDYVSSDRSRHLLVLSQTL